MTDTHMHNREPWIVQDPDFKREWLLPEPLQYYLYNPKPKEWVVINHWWDMQVGKAYPSREKAIREFYKLQTTRRIPPYRKLPLSPNANHKT